MKVKIYNRDVACKNVNDFIEKNKIVKITANDFLDENRYLIFSQLTFSEKIKIQNELKKAVTITENDLTVNTYIPCPCEFEIDSENIDKQIIIKSTTILSNEIDVNNFITNNSNIDDIQKNQNIRIKVYWWGKRQLYTSLDNNNEMIHRKSGYYKFEEISPDNIKSVNTSVSENGGEFNLNLSFSIADIHSNPIYRLKDNNDVDINNISNYYSDTINTTWKNQNINRKVIKDYFNSIFSINDIIMINLKPSVDAAEIYDDYFDMIGLINTISINVDYNGNVAVSLSGSDLMKLIREDGSFFFNISATNNVKTDLFNNPTEMLSGDVQDINNIKYGEAFNRLRLPLGELNMFYLRNLDIATVILGTITKLSNIRIAPDELFEPWNDLRTKLIDFQKK